MMPRPNLKGCAMEFICAMEGRPHMLGCGHMYGIMRDVPQGGPHLTPIDYARTHRSMRHRRPKRRRSRRQYLISQGLWPVR